MNAKSEVTLLECPNCLHPRDWRRESEPSPGFCPMCRSKRPWNVVKERSPPGYVRVMSIHGSQELKGPYWQEDPNAWVKDK